MSGIVFFGLGFLAGGVFILALAYFLGKREGGKAEQELTRKWSERSGLTREPGETFEAFTGRATESAAQRELEKEWGVQRADGEAWGSYMQRVAKLHYEARQKLVGMPVVIGPRGQA